MPFIYCFGVNSINHGDLTKKLIITCATLLKREKQQLQLVKYSLYLIIKLNT